MTHYPFTKVNDLSFEFFTIYGLGFKAYFIAYGDLFASYPEFAEDVFSFNLEVILDNTETNIIDEKIGLTVAEIFRDFFKTRKNVAIYVCDSFDNRQLARKKKFDMWFWKYNDGSLIKEDSIAVIADFEIYNSLIIHKENPGVYAIINAFRSLNERADEK